MGGLSGRNQCFDLVAWARFVRCRIRIKTHKVAGYQNYNYQTFRLPTTLSGWGKTQIWAWKTIHSRITVNSHASDKNVLRSVWHTQHAVGWSQAGVTIWDGGLTFQYDIIRTINDDLRRFAWSSWDRSKAWVLLQVCCRAFWNKTDAASAAKWQLIGTWWRSKIWVQVSEWTNWNSTTWASNN